VAKAAAERAACDSILRCSFLKAVVDATISFRFLSGTLGLLTRLGGVASSAKAGAVTMNKAKTAAKAVQKSLGHGSLPENLHLVFLRVGLALSKPHNPHSGKRL
jgi:hypothetical protein